MATSRNKYMIMEQSTQTDSFGNNYPDLTTFPINDFIPSEKSRPYRTDENDIYRFDLPIGLYYNNFNLYDDISLWLNDIPYLSDDDYIGTEVLFYQKADIDKFFVSNLVS